MRILVDKEGEQVVRKLCDIALRSAGIENLNGVISILNTIEIEPLDLQSKEKVQPNEQKSEIK